MIWPLMLLGCTSVLLSPSCGGSSLIDLEPSWREEVRALLEADSWLQPSGPGHGGLSPLTTSTITQELDRGYNEGNRRTNDVEFRASKRALSALSRWKPFTSAWGLRGPRPPSRAPLVSALLPPEADLVSAETRALLRPVGQPLRWGKRRRR